MRILASNEQEMYQLVEEPGGQLVLEIVLGDIGWYEMRVPLNAEETTRYSEEGASFVKWLVDHVRADPDNYRR
jgi:hypothetical protein